MQKSVNVAYTFSPSTNQVNLSGISNFAINDLYQIIDLTTNTTIYSIGIHGYGYSAVSGTLVTLQASMVGLQSTDTLMIIYDDGSTGSAGGGGGTASSVAINSPIGTNTKAASVSITLASDQLLSVTRTGSTGTDYSINPASIPINGFVLLQTIPLTSSRSFIEVQNQSASMIQIVRDDGSGNNQTSLLLNATGANSPGGGWSSDTFKGRLRIYGPTGSQVASYQD